MPLLNKDAILAAQDLASQVVPVPEWGGDVRVRVLTALERDQFGAALVGADGKADYSQYRVKLVAACMCGEGDTPLFGLAEVQVLAGKSSTALERVFAAADKLNALGGEQIEAAEKN